jgi:DNA helicase-2/ATP-dependent DNA helicase PcrA
MSKLSEIMHELTPAQMGAVAWQDGSMFVLAGPGSGKTMVLTARISRILAESPDETFRVLALTFTNKAADEMVARVISAVPDAEKRASIGTFHSFCMQILQQHGTHIGIQPDFTIYSLDADRKEILKSAMREVGVQDEESRYLRAIDRLKAALIEPEACSGMFRDEQIDELVKSVFAAYEARLRDLNALDFGALISKTYKLVKEFPGIARRIRRTYRYWMFDEFQDTNEGQYRLIRSLAGDEFQNVFAVADDDQIIYQWNGANFKQIQRFRADFAPAEIQLPTNYRCPPDVVALANSLVIHNEQRTSSKSPLLSGKKMLRHEGEDHVTVLRYQDSNAECEGISKRIFQLGELNWGTTVVLARNRAVLDAIQTALQHHGVRCTIAQRRDEFLSSIFQWSTGVLRLAMRPQDKMALDVLVSAFNNTFDLDVQLEDVISSSEISNRSLVSEWSEAVRERGVPDAIELSRLAMALCESRNGYMEFVDTAVARFIASDDAQSDVQQDYAAWREICRSIQNGVGATLQLEQFLQELAIRSKEPPIGRNTVTLMTIHGSKGKEFDYVFLVGLAEDILPSFQSVKAGEKSPEMEEERRNCFVGITRTKEWLYLSFAESYRGYRKQPSRFLAEMGVSLPAVYDSIT